MSPTVRLFRFPPTTVADLLEKNYLREDDPNTGPVFVHCLRRGMSALPTYVAEEINPASMTRFDAPADPPRLIIRPAPDCVAYDEAELKKTMRTVFPKIAPLLDDTWGG